MKENEIHINYRKLQKNEGERLWNLMNAIDYETKYMLYEPGERVKNLQRMEMIIEAADSDEDFLVVAEVDGELVGYISAQTNPLKRVAHSAYIVVGIRKQFCGKGIGTEFFGKLDEWAEKRKISRLELTVICENEAAKHLYEKCGFEIEGIKKKSVLVEGEFLDEYYMAKLL